MYANGDALKVVKVQSFQSPHARCFICMHKYVFIRPLFLFICMYVCIYMHKVMNIYVLLKALHTGSRRGRDAPFVIISATLIGYQTTTHLRHT